MLAMNELKKKELMVYLQGIALMKRVEEKEIILGVEEPVEACEGN